MKATIVFEKTWEAINAKNEDGSRKYKYIIHTGSSRSSKTYSILQTHWIICLTNPNTRVSIWRETKADCKMTILADLKKAVPTFPNNENVIFNKTESVYTFQNGSTIEFMGGDEENRVHGFQGNVSHLNEPYKFSKATFDQIDMRTIDYVIIDWNPKSKHFIDELSKRDNAIVIHSTYKDNPFIPDQQRKKILSYDPNNTFNIEQGTADAYLHSVYALGLKAEKPNRIHKNWIKISDAEFDRLIAPNYFGLDFGTTNPCGLVEVKYLEPRTFFTKQRLYKPSSQLETSLSSTLLAMGLTKKDLIVADTGGQTDILSIAELVNAGLNVVPAIKGAGSVNQGINFINNSVNHYTESSEDLEYEYENYEWEIINGMNLERPIKKDDHLLNADRYIKTFLQFRYNIK